MDRRWKLPRTRSDRIAVCVFFFGGLFLLWYELCFILPLYYPDWTTARYIHILISMILACSIYGNMFMFVTTDVTGSGAVFPTGPPPAGWHYCDTCQRNSPPRSHHCKMCKICIMKRDHHCWFAGYCVGYQNHRYYAVMVIYMTLAGIYCNLFNIDFVGTVKTFGIWGILSFFAPHAGLVFGYEDVYTCIITLITSVGFLLTGLFLWLLFIQLHQLLRGQTKHEKNIKVGRYDLGLKENILEVFGDRWYLVWLLPWIPSKLPGNGVSFRTTQSKGN